MFAKFFLYYLGMLNKPVLEKIQTGNRILEQTTQA
jgi:hypothetical protein